MQTAPMAALSMSPSSMGGLLWWDDLDYFIIKYLSDL